MMGKKNVLNSKFKEIKLNNVQLNNNKTPDLNTLKKKFESLLKNYKKIPVPFKNTNLATEEYTISLSKSGLEFLRSFQLYLSKNNIELNGKKKSYHEILVGIKNNKTNLIPNILNITLNLVTSIGYLKDGCSLSSGIIRKKGIFCGKMIGKKDLQEIYNTFFFGENNTLQSDKKISNTPQSVEENTSEQEESNQSSISNNLGKIQINIANDYISYIEKLDSIFNQIKIKILLLEEMKMKLTPPPPNK